MSIDNSYNDGAKGENDDVQDSVETLIGSPGNDVLIGSDATEKIFGLGGDDVINPGFGYDAVSSGEGDDTLMLCDGVVDVFTTAPGNDRVDADPNDVRQG